MIEMVYLVTILLIVTKLCDVVSTLQRIGPANLETNPIVRQMMDRAGTKRSIWAVLLLSTLIIGISAYFALDGGMMMQVLFVLMGTGISGVQGAVAHCNWTGKDNFITRRIRKWHSILLARLISNVITGS